MSKIYTTKSNAQRAAKKFDVAQVVEVEGGFIVQTPEQGEPVRDINDDMPEAPKAKAPKKAPAKNDGLVNMGRIDGEPGATGTVFDGIPGSIPAEAPAEAEPVLMQLRVYLNAKNAVSLAYRVASLVGNPVTIHAASGNQVQMVQPGEKAAKAAKGERKARDASSGPTGKTAKIVELAVRDEGVTRAELATVIGWGKAAPWTTVLKQAAERFGYELVINKDGRIATYFMVAQAA